MFALGIVLIFIHTGIQPFLDYSNQVRQNVYDLLRDNIEDFWETVEEVPYGPKLELSDDFKDLIENMLKPKP